MCVRNSPAATEVRVGGALGVKQKFPTAQESPMMEQTVPLNPTGIMQSRSLRAACGEKPAVSRG